MIVLAFDIATKTGVALGRVGSSPISFTVDLGKNVSDAERFSKAYRMTSFYIKKFGPDLVAIEDEVGGGIRSGFLTGLISCVKAASFSHKVDVKGYNIGAIRKHFIGGHITSASTQFKSFEPKRRKAMARNAAKSAVMARCVMLGWDPKDDNQSDSMALWDYACSQESRAHQLSTVGGLFA